MDIPVEIKPDESGYTGRECPECDSYFKIRFGTGLEEEGPCHCPYCGHGNSHDEFWTTDQVEYATSVVFKKVADDFLNELKKLERKPDPNAIIDFGITVKGKPVPIDHYTEQELEQEVTCERCTLEYAIYGTFGWCPDCGVHNSLQILRANLDLIEKILALAENTELEIKVKLVENAIEDIVSTLDGFGRELCRIHADKTTNPEIASKISFQRIEQARDSVKKLFNLDFAAHLDPSQWQTILVDFQKRHLITHKMGVIDRKFIDVAGSKYGEVGRKLALDPMEVGVFANLIRNIADELYKALELGD